MDFAYSPAEEAFRVELRTWLRANLPEHRKRFPPSDDELTLHPDKAFDSSLAWHQRMHEGGWIGVDWPREYGGRGATILERMIFFEELVAAGAPPGVNTVGLGIAGPAIMAHGTAAQKAQRLPAILSAREIWCQGFSEPGAGSDLAALSTRAELDGDHYVVNGQKVWTSNAHRAQWCILLVRTDPAAPKHKGISCLLVDMASPGITLRPLKQITGDSEFNEVFFDGLRVPRANLLGRPGGGWDVAVTVLMYERMMLGATTILQPFLDGLLQLARRDGRSARDPVLRQRLAEIYTLGRAIRLTNLRYVSRQLGGHPPSAEGSVIKLTLTETYRQLAETAAQIAGPYGQLWKGAPPAPDDGRWAFQALFALRWGIAGGTSEVQHNIIGERLLGLPK